MTEIQERYVFNLNKRILAYFCVDHTEVWMTTKLVGKDTYFLPFNQGSNGAGSGKSNSIAWTAYRLASLFNENNKPVFFSVIVVTDRNVLDAQLQETISGFDHKLGAIETIGEDKNSQEDAINDGVRIIVTTLQKFPVIYTEVDKANGRYFAVIVDEAQVS